MKTILFASLMLLVSSADAAPLSVPQVRINRTITVDYECPGGKRFSVTYLNGDNGQNFAVMPYRGKTLLLTNSMSADGVKFQTDSLTWWIKGRGGALSDARVDADKPVLAGCKTK